jgi:hypothetical protein
MKLRVWANCDCGCDERTFISFRSKPFQFRWFMDCGEWFIYIHIGKRYWRFSSAGYLKGRVND